MAEPYLQTDLFVKVVLSIMLGRRVEEYLDAQNASRTSGGCASSPTSSRTATSSRLLLADHGLFHLEADLRWIDLTESRLAALAEEVVS